jgi:hypothetical protein
MWPSSIPRLRNSARKRELPVDDFPTEYHFPPREKERVADGNPFIRRGKAYTDIAQVASKAVMKMAEGFNG